MQEISKDLTNDNFDSNLFQEFMNNLDSDLDENQTEWSIQENYTEMSKQLDSCELKDTLTEKVGLCNVMFS